MGFRDTCRRVDGAGLTLKPTTSAKVVSENEDRCDMAVAQCARAQTAIQFFASPASIRSVLTPASFRFSS